jgi:hypothetical protein
MVSTPLKKTVFYASFLKPGKMKAIQTCNTAGFLSPRFSGWAIGGAGAKKGAIAKIPPEKRSQ